MGRIQLIKTFSSTPQGLGMKTTIIFFSNFWTQHLRRIKIIRQLYVFYDPQI